MLGQRLLRRVCSNCRAEQTPERAHLTALGLTDADIADKKFYYGRGCTECNDTGYRGRTGIFELLRVTPEIRGLINERAPTAVIRRKAIEQGMRTMRDDGLRNIFDGVTTVEEVLKYT